MTHTYIERPHSMYVYTYKERPRRPRSCASFCSCCWPAYSPLNPRIPPYIGHFPQKRPIYIGHFPQKSPRLFWSCCWLFCSCCWPVYQKLGCLKLQVIFCKRATNDRALLRTMTYKDKASYEFTPHVYCRLTNTGWRRATGCLISIGHFPQKSPMIRGSFAENDPKHRACYGL